MSLTGALSGVGGYHHHHELGRDQPAQQHLSVARQDVLAQLPPLGYIVKCSGISSRSMPQVAWLAVLDPDVTLTAKRGLYVVYLFNVGTTTVYLSMNQGATAHLDYYTAHRPTGMGIEAAATAEIGAETKAIRDQLGSELLVDTRAEIDLGGTGFFPRGYEAGNIAALAYDLIDLPLETQLRADLQRFLLLYQEAVVARSAVIASNPDRFNVAAPPPADTAEPGAIFRPKDSSDYVAWIKEHRQKRTPKHEKLINNFAKHAMTKGWTASTKGAHPRDLVLDKDAVHLLIEGKTVRANTEHAVREAIGQLFAYEFVYYSGVPTNKVALFSAPVGELWLQLLGQLSIDAIWLDGSAWRSSGPMVGWI